MNTTVSQKVCPKCEERIHENAVSCPYCGCATVSSQAPQQPTAAPLDEQFAPPYQFEQAREEAITAIPKPVYSAPVETEPTPTQQPFKWDDDEDLQAEIPPEPETMTEPEPIAVEPNKQDELKAVLIPTVCLLAGAVFFMFGMALFLGSTDGVLTLQWNGNTWPFYLLTSVPLFYYGWKVLQNLE